MDITAIEGRELTSVEFGADFVKLRFIDSTGSAGPMFTLYAWPHCCLRRSRLRMVSRSIATGSARRSASRLRRRRCMKTTR